ncbi:MAG: glycosyltransferase family 4 protein [Desulfocucumaceae bacterium]
MLGIHRVNLEIIKVEFLKPGVRALVKTKVMHVVRPSAGGIKKHLLTLIEASDSDRFEHTVACPSGAMTSAFLERGIRVFPLPLRGEISPVTDLAAIRELFTLFKIHRVDIVHAHSSKAGLVGRLAAGLAGVPAVVMTVHNSIFYHHLPRWKKNVFAASERLLAGCTGRIITVSEELRREIIVREKISSEKVVTIYNGLTADAFNVPADREYVERATGIPPHKRIVATVARLAPQKGVAYFIRAASLLSESNDNTVFLVIGDGPMREELEREAGGLKLSGRVIFAGERKDVSRIMPCLDVFVLASVTEGLPLTVLEAMAAGRPVVATRVGGVPEIIEHGKSGLLVDPGDVAGLASSIKNILDSEKYNEMASNGKSLVLGRFTAKKMGDQTDLVYSSLLHCDCPTLIRGEG